MRANALAISLLSKDTNSFWKNVSVSRNKKVFTPTKVDDCVGDNEITDMWRNHYSTLLNSVHSSIDKDRVLSYLNDCSSEYSAISISFDDVNNGLKHVKLDKSFVSMNYQLNTLFILAITLKYIYPLYLLILFHMVTYPMVL